GADTRGVGLDDAEHVIEVTRADAGAGGSAAGRGVRRGHVRVGAEVDVEQRALRALEKDVAAFAVNAVQGLGDVGHHRRELLAEREVLLQRLLEVDRLDLVIVPQHEVVEVEDLAELGGEAFPVQQVAEAHRAARDLVLVGRADAAAGGADGIAAARLFARLVERDMAGKDQRAGRADAQPLARRDALRFQHVEFFGKRHRVQDDAVADEAFDAVTEDAGGNQLKHSLVATDDQGVAGVVAALETHHATGALGEQVDDLALAFITPLGADHDDILGHGNSLGILEEVAGIYAPRKAAARPQAGWQGR